MIKKIRNIMFILGSIFFVVGAIVFGIGYYYYDFAKGMVRAWYTGSRSSYNTLLIWENHQHNAKIAFIIGIVVACIGIILLVVALILHITGKNKFFKRKTQEPSLSLTDQLKELQELKDSGYITDEEYEQKRKSILNL